MAVAPPPASVAMAAAPPPASAVMAAAPPPACAVMADAPPPASAAMAVAPPPALGKDPPAPASTKNGTDGVGRMGGQEIDGGEPQMRMDNGGDPHMCTVAAGRKRKNTDRNQPNDTFVSREKYQKVKTASPRLRSPFQVTSSPGVNLMVRSSLKREAVKRENMAGSPKTPQPASCSVEDLSPDTIAANSHGMIFPLNHGMICKGVKQNMQELFNDYNKEVSGASHRDSSSQEVQDDNDPLAEWDRYMKSKRHQSSNELDQYLIEQLTPRKEEVDILHWWKTKSEIYPVLSNIARDVLAIPASTVPSKSAFSTGGRVISDYRSSLTPTIVEALICLQDWFKAADARKNE